MSTLKVTLQKEGKRVLVRPSNEYGKFVKDIFSNLNISENDQAKWNIEFKHDGAFTKLNNEEDFKLMTKEKRIEVRAVKDILNPLKIGQEGINLLFKKFFIINAFKIKNTICEKTHEKVQQSYSKYSEIYKEELQEMDFPFKLKPKEVKKHDDVICNGCYKKVSKESDTSA